MDVTVFEGSSGWMAVNAWLCQCRWSGSSDGVGQHWDRTAASRFSGGAPRAVRRSGSVLVQALVDGRTVDTEAAQEFRRGVRSPEVEQGA
jgi:hypothetical protein